MNPFLFASARDAATPRLVADCLEQIGRIPAEANLGFVYATDSLADDFAALHDQLAAAAPQVHWVGTVGMGICAGASEIYDQPALCLLIGNFPADSFRIVPSFGGEQVDSAQEVAVWREQQDYCFALLHGDPGNPATPSLLGQLAQSATSGFLNGGLSSSNGPTPQLADDVVQGGLSGVLFNQQVRVLTDHSQGCSPIGPPHEITDAQRNVAITLDRRPALEVMRSDIGEVLARDLRKIAGYVFAALPITGSDTGDYLVRNLVGVDAERGLIAVGDLLEGQQRMMFCRRDGNSAREDLQRMLERLRKRVADKTIRGGVYISCLGRGRYQFGENSEELELIERTLGEFPLVGFFANGEIYNGRLYGYTGVLTLFL